jgi:hypothetical protein
MSVYLRSANKLQRGICHPVSAEASSRPPCVSYEWFVVDTVAEGQVFPPNNSGFPCLYHSTNIQFTASSTCCAYQKGKGTKRGNLHKEFFFKLMGFEWSAILNFFIKCIIIRYIFRIIEETLRSVILNF